MAIARPRLNDYHELPFTQEEVDFAIPFLDEDIPLFIDPFLLWKSPSLQDNSLHTAVVNSFNHLGMMYRKGDVDYAVTTLISASECNEVGLGSSRKKKGHRMGPGLALEVLGLFDSVPQIKECGFLHFEEIQLLVENVSKDRVSDIASTFLKSFLIDYTIQSCEQYGIPVEECSQIVYDYRRNVLTEETTNLPLNPSTGDPIILVPKRWLRYSPWIRYDDYFRGYYLEHIERNASRKDRVSVLTYNRTHYDVLQAYVAGKERTQADCRNDPLFTPIPVTSAKRKLSKLAELSIGIKAKADRQFEDLSSQLLASLLYPHLDFAELQSRTQSGVLIRDLIFYNNRSTDFLAEIYDSYCCRQIVVEMKNVQSVKREHITQLNRYMTDSFGRFGVILARNKPSSNILRNTIDLWSGQRRCILILDDSDLCMMVEVFESKQRDPIEVLKKKYVEFSRMCPG